MTFREEIIGDCRLINADCREVLPTLGKVDAVVTDPPYGIAVIESTYQNKKTKPGAALAHKTNYDIAETWDNEPVSQDLMALVRGAGKHAIIFGGNYYDCPAASCWLVWDKENGNNDFADCELAWTNLPKAVRRIKFMWNGMLRAGGEARGDHPTQKPIGVMRWCISQLPADALTIIDPFMGSGTTGVACVGMGKHFIGIERETKYFDAACRRIAEAYRQPRLFKDEAPKPVQLNILDGAA